MTINIPSEVQFIINTLEESGYEAYVVGGCVRDAVLGVEPKDWDICTSALPQQTINCFEGQRIIETGLQHGTVTLLLNHTSFEITTFRVDGIYSDNRRPDKVDFVNDIKEDLLRRDFTINAMAYNPTVGLVDFFGGLNDINGKIIRCVGDADKRFQEDALRVMRALRFASVLYFSIDENTSQAIHRNKSLLKNIAVERIAVELNKLIIGRNVSDVLLQYHSVLTEFIPEIKNMVGFNQNNPYHHLDVWEHTVTSIAKATVNHVIRLSMLFHDIAKPLCYTEDERGGHFYGHPKVCSDMAKEILQRLKYDNDTIDAVTQLVLYHDAEIHPRKKHIKRWLNKIGELRLRQLLEIKFADANAQSPEFNQKKIDLLNAVAPVINEIMKQQQCFSLKDLAINGKDIIAAGVSEGVKVGVILNHLMDMVIDEQVENDKSKLLDVVNKLVHEINV